MRLRALILAVIAALFVPEARADGRQQCIEAYEGAQRLHREDNLLAARDRAAACKKLCPAPFIADCTRWEADWTAAIPSVLLEAKDARGEKVAGVRVSIDGSTPEPLKDGPMPLNPGKHTVAFVGADGRIVERTVTLAPRERDRRVVALFDAPLQPQPTPRPEPVASEREVPVASWVLGAIGLAALTAGGVLAVVGYVDRANAEAPPPEGCAPDCGEERIDRIRNYWIAAGVLAGAGGVMVIVAIILPFVTDDGSQQSARISAQLGNDGAALGARLSF